MISTSANRVAENTAEPVNEQIQQGADIRVAYFAAHPELIDRRLDQLDQEWDIERALEMTSASLSAFGLVLGILGRRRWLLLPAVVQGFFLQHAVQGWCPPIEALRRMGFRTQSEIEAERYALKAIRGDFADIEGEENGRSAEERAEAAMQAVIGGRHVPMGSAGVKQNQPPKRQRRRSGGKASTIEVGREPSDLPGPTPSDQSGSGSSRGDLGPGKRGIPRPDVGPTS